MNIFGGVKMCAHQMNALYVKWFFKGRASGFEKVKRMLYVIVC